jgi:DNA-binding NtrC family response regulator
MNARSGIRPKILIVDDSEIVCDSVSTMLEPRGYDVVALTSLFAFTQTLAAERPDLVLVDVSMPALNGDKLIEISRKHHANRYKMVLFSNRGQAELKTLAAQCGAIGYIQKTGDAERLAREVDVFLHGGG